MNASVELIFFFVFFVPMGIMVTLNILLHRTLPDVSAPWARLAGTREEAQPEPRQEAPMQESAVEAGVSNEEDALEAA